jgi:AcrR family transcriptional regulator
MDPLPTRERIVAAASRLFYREGIRAVSVDAVAAEAGLTKRSLYYHFKSKDDLVAAYLDYRDLPNLSAFRRWYAQAEGGVADRFVAIFEQLASTAAHPAWRGCGFLRTAAELADLPGHPAITIGAAHKKKVEQWFAACLAEDGIADPDSLAAQIRLLLDGAFSVVMLHRDPAYMLMAGDAVRALIESAARHGPADGTCVSLP